MRLVHAIAAALVSVGLSTGSTAFSQGFPTKPIRMIVPGGVGSSSDVVTRAIAQEMTKGLGQAVIVENKAGAAGVIGTMEAARQPADGYTLLAGNVGTHLITPLIKKGELGYDPVKDFTPLVFVQQVPLFIAVNPSLKVDTLAQFIELAKRKPGEITVASSGPGLTIAAAQLGLETQTKLSIIAYKGAGQALTDVVAGHVNAHIDTGIALLPHMKSGRIKVIAVMSTQRVAQYPDIPTVAEIVPGFEVVGANAIFAAGKVPPAVAERLAAEINKAIATPSVQQLIQDGGGVVVNSDGEQFTRWMLGNMAKWKNVIEKTGLQLD